MVITFRKPITKVGYVKGNTKIALFLKDYMDDDVLVYPACLNKIVDLMYFQIHQQIRLYFNSLNPNTIHLTGNLLLFSLCGNIFS